MVVHLRAEGFAMIFLAEYGRILFGLTKPSGTISTLHTPASGSNPSTIFSLYVFEIETIFVTAFGKDCK